MNLPIRLFLPVEPSRIVNGERQPSIAEFAFVYLKMFAESGLTFRAISSSPMSDMKILTDPKSKYEPYAKHFVADVDMSQGFFNVVIANHISDFQRYHTVPVQNLAITLAWPREFDEAIVEEWRKHWDRVVTHRVMDQVTLFSKLPGKAFQVTTADSLKFFFAESV